MPKKEVFNTQARKMIYNVNCYIKKETNEILDDLKLVTNATAAATLALRKNLTANIISLDLITNRIMSAVDKSILKEICIKLEKIREETEESHNANENKLQLLIKNLKQCQKRTAMATNSSVSTVRKISTLADNSELDAAFSTPGKKRRRIKPVTGIDNVGKGVVKRYIRNFHLANKDFLTVEKLRSKLQRDINFHGSETSVRRVIKNLGFRWKKIHNNRKILIETSKIRQQRFEYLKKIKQYRLERRPIIYTGESYVDSLLLNSKAQADSATQVQPISKDKRVVVVHAGSEAGFVPNALLTFEAGNYQHNNDNYEKWIRTQLMPNIPQNSVVVFDNTSYYDKQCDLELTLNSKKADIEDWLNQKGIKYDQHLSKQELYKIIKENREQFNTFAVDKILSEHHHSILRLPPCHSDLNPVDMAWSIIKQYVVSKNVNSDLHNTIKLVKEKVDVMWAREWMVLCDKVKAIEEEYAKYDHYIDNITEQYAIRASDDSSGSDDTQDEDDGSEMSDDNEKPCTSASVFLPPPHSSMILKDELMDPLIEEKMD